MNRYIIEGIVADVRDGKRVWFVGISHTFVREVFDQVLKEADDTLRYRRTAGELAIMGSGRGIARFISARSSAYRGHVADVVILHGTLGNQDYLPMIATTNGELIWA